MSDPSAINLLPRPRIVRLDSGGTAAADAIEFRTDSSRPAQGYRLELNQSSAVLTASDDAGRFYGQATLSQLRRLRHDGSLPIGLIEDWPDLAVRGVMLDVSRDKVPTMATLTAVIDRLASWKINQLQLYMEHTFAYRDHAEVWAEASPFTADEIGELDRFCAERHIELVPNRNCLGHMERWLRHDRYRQLAIRPEGHTSKSGRWWPPTTLDPANPASLELVRGLLAELLPCFSSRQVHLGLDEPWELTADRIGDYLEYIRQLRAAPETEGREVLIWGDILANHPGAAAELPEGVTVCEWGYEDWWPFPARSEALAATGRPFWLCPGTSSWLSILGRSTNAIGNNRAAVEAALATGATGILNTDWGDFGHLQYLPVSEPGVAAGAAFSWCLEANADLNPDRLAAALDVHCFDDPSGALGQALLALGDAHRIPVAQVPNMSILCLPLYQPGMRLGDGFTSGLTAGELAQAEASIGEARDALGRARPGRDDGALIVDELRAGADLVMLMCRDGQARLKGDGSLAALPAATRHQLAAQLEPVLDRHRALWSARNRPGGLADSLSWLERLLARYRHVS
ncbi:MAG TPA: family 20 glycosylhydrolase [Acidimicrobiales bacterium]|nr:family 20 glycosylhydrolase [Acidimicrobiales bacterium]